MSLLPAFFKTKKNTPSTPPAPTCQIAAEEISIRMLKELIPIRNFDEEKLAAFVTNLTSEVYAPGTILFRMGDTTDSALYLLKGRVTLADDTGKTYEISEGTAQARFPLSSGAKHTTTAQADSDISILRVSQKIMSSRDASSNHYSQLVIPDELADNPLLQSFQDHYLCEKLELPTLPEVAVKLRHAIQQDVGIAEATKIIQLDPVISAKLIELANCPLYVCTSPAKSCLEAIGRIGLNATRNLVISISLHQIYKSHSPLIKKLLDRLWKQSVQISILSFVLAKITRQANPEEALLAGLICDLGAVPFLHFVDKLPKDYFDEEDLNQALACVKGPIGYKLLTEWGFPEEFIKVPIFSSDWFQNTSDQLCLTDIVVLARLHNEMGRTDMANLPVVTSIPAASKLKNYSLSPELSLSVLHNAKQQINEALKAFSIQ